MARQNGKSTTANLKWITERETALSVLTKLAELRRASRYDLASKLEVSYATVMNYISKFIEAGIVREIGEVEAERGGKKVLYEPTEKALKFLSQVEPSELATAEIRPPSALPSLGFYSLGTAKRGEMTKRRNKIQDILDDMRVDVAVVVNYKGNPIPIVPLSTLGGIDQVSSIFNENINQRIREVAGKIAEGIAGAEKPRS